MTGGTTFYSIDELQFKVEKISFAFEKFLSNLLACCSCSLCSCTMIDYRLLTEVSETLGFSGLISWALTD